MTTETTARDQAKEIWDRLDAEDRGDATPPEKVERVVEVEQGTAQAAPETTPERTEPITENEDDPKALRNKIAGLEQMINSLGGRLRNAEGHIGGLNSQIKGQLEAARLVTQAGDKAPSASEIREAQASPEALQNLERDYPEFARALKPTMDAIESRLATLKNAPAQQEPPAQAETPSYVTKAEMDRMRNEMAVESVHPGWQKKVAGAEFVGWLESAPREAKLLASSADPQDAIRLLDLYSGSKTNSAPENTQRLKSAAALPTGNRSAVRTKNVDEMTPQEYWRYLDQIDKQKSKD